MYIIDMPHQVAKEVVAKTQRVSPPDIRGTRGSPSAPSESQGPVGATCYMYKSS